MNYFFQALKQFADFKGRARRKEYWMFYLFYIVFYIILSMIDMALGTFIHTFVFAIALLIPSISIAARRLHDTGRTGWWQLILFVPLIGFIVMLIFLVQDSHDDNEYGPNPKAVA